MEITKTIRLEHEVIELHPSMVRDIVFDDSIPIEYLPGYRGYRFNTISLIEDGRQGYDVESVRGYFNSLGIGLNLWTAKNE